MSRDIVRFLLSVACDELTELRIYGYWSCAIFTLNETYELIVLLSIVGVTLAAVYCEVDSLRTYDLACRSDERHETCVAAHLRDEGHSLFEKVFLTESAEVGHHIGVHTAGHLCILNQLIGLRQAEICLNLVASVEKLFFLIGLGSLDGAIKLSVNLLGHSLVSLVEVFRPLVLIEVKLSESLAGILKFMTNLGNGLHIDIYLNTELAAENVDKLDRGSCGATAKPPDVGVDDIDATDNGSEHSCKTITGGAMSVEVDVNLHCLLEFRHKSVDTRRAYETGHILEGNHLGTELLHLLGLVDKIIVGKDLFSFRSALGVDSVADSGVGNATEVIDHLDRALSR